MKKISSMEEYYVWVGMRTRCDKENHQAYKWYGGRGITYCDRWKDFRNFIEDMGRRPSKKHTIDRIDGDGNYEPENCRWATWKEQASHRKPKTQFTILGETMSAGEHCKKNNIHLSTFYTRFRSGKTGEDLIKPAGKKYRNRRAL